MHVMNSDFSIYCSRSQRGQRNALDIRRVKYTQTSLAVFPRQCVSQSVLYENIDKSITVPLFSSLPRTAVTFQMNSLR